MSTKLQGIDKLTFLPLVYSESKCRGLAGDSSFSSEALAVCLDCGGGAVSLFLVGLGAGAVPKSNSSSGPVELQPPIVAIASARSFYDDSRFGRDRRFTLEPRETALLHGKASLPHIF